MTHTSVMLAGMKNYYLSFPDITAIIGDRLEDTVSVVRINALTNPTAEVPSRKARFVEYRDVSERVGRLKRAESGMVFTDVEFRCYALLPKDARDLWELFFEQFTNNSYSGTWHDGETDIEIHGAHWNRETRNTDYDDTVLMSVATCTLVVPWTQR